MAIATVTSKGQVTIPKTVRDDLGIETGTKLLFIRMSNGQYFLTAKRGSVMDLLGSLKYDGPPVSIEDMDRGIGDLLAADDARIQREWHENRQDPS